jgi:hypothetical protein
VFCGNASQLWIEEHSCVNVCHREFFLWWRAPQQKLRTHRSLEAYCATLWWRWLVFFFVFPYNGAPVERNRQGKTEVLREKPVPVSLCPPKISHGLTRDWTRAFAAWAMERPSQRELEGRAYYPATSWLHRNLPCIATSKRTHLPYNQLIIL